ncbi:hypothetical protein FPRO05_05144 [Fusarium proliferatum]|uniref:Uncharacterized protein n=1 Tax=Gibberella intermedia TaxID=948311 RepID=A0A365MQ19_GIBIN|nr:hypothetical protein FPRO05_05144 [Fusarium proliferatum]
MSCLWKTRLGCRNTGSQLRRLLPFLQDRPNARMSSEPQLPWQQADSMEPLNPPDERQVVL